VLIELLRHSVKKLDMKSAEDVDLEILLSICGNLCPALGLNDMVGFLHAEIQIKEIYQ